MTTDNLSIVLWQSDVSALFLKRQERMDYYNSRGMEVHQEIQAKKLQKFKQSRS